MSKYTRHEALYATLEDLMAERKQDITVVEVGTRSGKQAAGLCKYWKEQTDGKFTYVGFDLFEGNDKQAVAETLRRAGAQADLIAGSPVDTVPAFAEVMSGQVVPDLLVVNMDGKADDVEAVWTAARIMVGPGTTVLFDHHFDHRDDVGCKATVARLKADARWQTDLLNEADRLPDGNEVRIACVRRVRTFPLPTARAA